MTGQAIIGLSTQQANNFIKNTTYFCMLKYYSPIQTITNDSIDVFHVCSLIYHSIKREAGKYRTAVTSTIKLQ